MTTLQITVTGKTDADAAWLVWKLIRQLRKDVYFAGQLNDSGYNFDKKVCGTASAKVVRDGA